MGKPMTIRIKYTMPTDKNFFGKPTGYIQTERDFGGNSSENIKAAIKFLVQKDYKDVWIHYGDTDETITLNTLFVWLERNAELNGREEAVKAYEKQMSDFNNEVKRAARCMINRLVNNIRDKIWYEATEEMDKLFRLKFMEDEE